MLEAGMVSHAACPACGWSGGAGSLRAPGEAVPRSGPPGPPGGPPGQGRTGPAGTAGRRRASPRRRDATRAAWGGCDQSSETNLTSTSSSRPNQPWVRPMPVAFTPRPGSGGVGEGEVGVVHRDGAGLDARHQALRTLAVAGPDGGREPVLAVVGELHRLVLAVEGGDGEHGAEGLLPHHQHVRGHVGQHGGLVEQAFAGRVRHTGGGRPCRAHPARGAGRARGRRAWSWGPPRCEDPAGPPSPGRWCAPRAVSRTRPPRSGARTVAPWAAQVWPAVHERGPHRAAGRALQGGVLEDQEGILAAQFQDDLAEARRGPGEDVPPHLRAPREDDGAHGGVGDPGALPRPWCRGPPGGPPGAAPPRGRSRR